MASVTVRYWAGAARAAGLESETLDAATLRDIRALLGARPSLERLSGVASLLVDGAQYSDNAALRDDAVVDVLPPFAGGATSPPGGTPEPGDSDTQRLAAQALADGEPTAWFDRLYVEADKGTAHVPWDRDVPTAMLTEELTAPADDGTTAVVVGCGYGRDAEYVASLGYTTTGFDISAAAIRAARDRHPTSAVTYEQADLFDLPQRWLGAFDLVVECNDVQALPPDLHEPAAAAVGSLVGPGGDLVVLMVARGDEPVDGPPWPLRRDEMMCFVPDGMTVTELRDFERDGVRRWWLRVHRDADGSQ